MDANARGTVVTLVEETAEPLLQAGDQAMNTEGDVPSGRSWFAAAYREAERQGDGVRMARAAVGLSGLQVHEHLAAADAAVVRRRQLAALGLIDPASPLALRLRARMAAEDDYAADGHAGIMDLLAEARRAGDPVALAEVLSLAHQRVRGPGYGGLRHTLARELLGVAPLTERRGDLLIGLLWNALDLLFAADPYADRCLRELNGMLEDGDHLAVRVVLAEIEVMRAIRDGRFDDAEALAAAAAERGERAGEASAPGWYAAQVGVIRWYQGRAAELVPVLTDLVGSPLLSSMDHAGYAGLAVGAAVAGDRRLAVGTVARLRGRLLTDPPYSDTWLFAMFALVEAADLLGDAETAAAAYDRLLPFADLPAMLCLGSVCMGSVRHALGVAALTAGRTDAAIDQLTGAVQDNLALGHWPAAMLSRWRLASALERRSGPRDPAVRRERETAGREAADLRMPLPNGAALPDRDAPGAACRRRGGQWWVELRGRGVLVDDCVGLRHLAVLFANPGYEISALDLAAGPGTEPSGSADASGQPLLDDEAKRTYKRRLAQLDAEIDELDAGNELERAATVRLERDWLVRELTAAAGLGGRTRRFAGSEERARIAVGKAIRRALKRIGDADPVLGAELRTTVHTGLLCWYRPA